MQLPASLAHLTHPDVRRFAAYWLAKRSGRPMPSYRDIDPTDIPWALPNLWVCDYLPEARDFRYRLAGEGIQAFFGTNFRTRMLREVVSAGSYEPTLERYRTVIETPAIAHNIGFIYLDEGRHVEGERLILPLVNGGETASMLAGFTVRDGGAGYGRGGWPDGKLATTYTPVQNLD